MAQTVNYTPSGGPIAAAPTPGYAQLNAAGLTDVSGNNYSVNASNYVAGPVGVSYPQPIIDARPANASVNQSCQLTFIAPASGGATARIFFRTTSVSGRYDAYAYIVSFLGNSAGFYYVVNGGGTIQIGNVISYSTVLTPGATYTANAVILQSNSTTTTLILTVADAAGNVYLYTTASDTTSALQGLSGTIGVQMITPSTTNANVQFANISFFNTAVNLAEAQYATELGLYNAEVTAYNASQAQVTSLTSQVNSLTTTNANLTSQVSSLTATNTANQTQIATLTAQATSNTAQINSLTATNAANQTQISGLNAQVSNLTAANTASQTQVASLTAANTSSQAQLTTLTAQVASLMAQVAAQAAAVVTAPTGSVPKSSVISYPTYAQGQPYCGAPDILALIGQVGAMNDGTVSALQIQNAIAQAGKKIDQQTNQEFSPKRTIRQYDGNGQTRMILPNRPLLSVNQITTYAGGLGSAGQILSDYSLAVDHKTGVISFPSYGNSLLFASGLGMGNIFPRGSKNILVDSWSGHYDEIFSDALTTTDMLTYAFSNPTAIKQNIPGTNGMPNFGPVIYLNGVPLVNTTFAKTAYQGLTATGQYQVATDQVYYTLNSAGNGYTSITFNSALQPTDIVTADYSYIIIPSDIVEATAKMASITLLSAIGTGGGYTDTQFQGNVENASEGGRIRQNDTFGKWGQVMSLWRLEISEIISQRTRLLTSYGSGYSYSGGQF